MDYSITWAYIVKRMKSKFGISIESEEKFSFGEIQKYIDDIWNEYFEMLKKEGKCNEE